MAWSKGIPGALQCAKPLRAPAAASARSVASALATSRRHISSSMRRGGSRSWPLFRPSSHSASSSSRSYSMKRSSW
jgi:hypothetical protein